MKRSLWWDKKTPWQVGSMHGVKNDSSAVAGYGEGKKRVTWVESVGISSGHSVHRNSHTVEASLEGITFSSSCHSRGIRGLERWCSRSFQSHRPSFPMSVLIAVFSSANGPAAIFLVAISCDDGKKILGQSYGCVRLCADVHVLSRWWFCSDVQGGGSCTQEVKCDFSIRIIFNSFSCWRSQELWVVTVTYIDSQELKAFKRKEGMFTKGL